MYLEISLTPTLHVVGYYPRRKRSGTNSSSVRNVGDRLFEFTEGCNGTFHIQDPSEESRLGISVVDHRTKWTW